MVARLQRGLFEIVLLAVLAGWLTLWGAVARIHLRMGDVFNASFTVFALALPAVLAYLVHLIRYVDSMPDPGAVAPSPSSG